MRIRSSRAGRRRATWTAVAGGSAAALVATAIATGLPTTSQANAPAVEITSANGASVPANGSPAGGLIDAVTGAASTARGAKNPLPSPTPKSDTTPGRKTAADPAKEKTWYYAPPKLMPTFTLPPERKRSGDVRVNAVPATFTVTYDASVPAGAKPAFQFALNTWAQYLDTNPSKPISIRATWTNTLPALQLGQTSVPLIGTNLAADAFGTTFYPQALYDQLKPSPDDSVPVDMTIAFNSLSQWYFGTDANPASGDNDFVSTAMHEIGHGLGITGGLFVDNMGLGQRSNPTVPVIFDQFTVAVNGTTTTPMLSIPNNSAALAAALQGQGGNQVFFRGPATGSAPGARLYAPSPWNGSGYGHLDELTYPPASGNSMMTPSQTTGTAEHNPGPLVRNMLTDMGWKPAVADTTAPDTTITGGPAENSTITTSTPTFTFTSTENPASFQCTVDAVVINCASPFTTPALAEGIHTLTVAATDASLNTDQSPATRHFTVDALPAGTISFSAPTYSVSEGDPVTITVTRTGGTDGAVSATYATANGTADGADYTAATNTVSFAAGDSAPKTFTITTTEDGTVEPDETVALSLSAPTNGASVGGPATLTITNDDAAAPNPGTIAFSASTYSVEEGNVATITVTRTGGSDGAVSATYSTANGTADGADYTGTTNTVTFAAGDSAPKTFTVTTSEDGTVEPDETVALSLSAPTGGATLGTAAATLTITNDDAVATTPGTIAFSAPAYSVEEGNVATITVTRTGGSDGPVSATYATANGTANSADYTGTAGTVTFAAGDSAPKTFTVTTAEDTTVEPDETVTLSLAGPTGGATLGTAAATLTITNDDVAAPATPVVTIVANDNSAAEAGGAGSTGQFTISRSGAPTTSALVVSIAVSGTATAGSDYTALPSTVTIPANAASATLTVTPINDAADEPDESVIVTVNPTAAYDIGAPGSATVTVVDDDPTPVVCTIDRRTATSGQAITGTAGNDVICGSNFADSIKGMGGNDVIYGGGGGDIIKGGDGNDTIYGEAGADNVDGEAGNDTIEGGADNDTLIGGIGDDIIRGGDGNDLVSGGTGADQLYGDAGNDNLKGEAGNDKLFGGAGADSLDGGADSDTLDGGSETDTCNAGAGSNPAPVNCP